MDMSEIDSKMFTILPPEMINYKIPNDLICTKSNMSTVNDEFTCPICLNLLFSPKNCLKCEQMFCANCVTKALEKNKNCPHCRNIFVESKIPRQLTALLNSVVILCPNNCRTKISYSDLQDHLLRCQFTQLKIKCNFCQDYFPDTMKLGRAKIHQTECGDVLIPCDQVGCKSTFKRKLKNNHLEYCDYVIIKCENCETSYTALKYGDHSRKQCANNIKYHYEEKLKEKDKIISKLHSQLDRLNLQMNSLNENEKINISIKMEDRKEIPLEVYKSDSVYKIKRKIEEIEGVSSNNIILVYMGKELANEMTVGEYNILESAFVYSLIR